MTRPKREKESLEAATPVPFRALPVGKERRSHSKRAGEQATADRVAYPPMPVGGAPSVPSRPPSGLSAAAGTRPSAHDRSASEAEQGPQRKPVKTRAGKFDANGNYQPRRPGPAVDGDEASCESEEGLGVSSSGLLVGLAIGAATVIAVTLAGGAIDIDASYAGAELRVRARGKRE